MHKNCNTRDNHKISKTKNNYHDITAWKINIIKTPFKHEQAKQ